MKKSLLIILVIFSVFLMGCEKEEVVEREEEVAIREDAVIESDNEALKPYSLIKDIKDLAEKRRIERELEKKIQNAIGWENRIITNSFRYPTLDEVIDGPLDGYYFKDIDKKLFRKYEELIYSDEKGEIILRPKDSEEYWFVGFTPDKSRIVYNKHFAPLTCFDTETYRQYELNAFGISSMKDVSFSPNSQFMALKGSVPDFEFDYLVVDLVNPENEYFSLNNLLTRMIKQRILSPEEIDSFQISSFSWSADNKIQFEITTDTKEIYGWEVGADGFGIKQISGSTIINTNTPIRDYVLDYFNAIFEFDYTAEVNNDNGILIVKIDRDTADEYRDLMFCYLEENIRVCSSRGLEVPLRILKEQFKSKFPYINELVFYFKNDLLYKDDTYLKEDLIVGLSDNGRYVELTNRHVNGYEFCEVFDMLTGECKLQYQHCMLCGLHEDEEDRIEGQQILYDQYGVVREKYSINNNIENTLGFLREKITVNNEVNIYGNIIDKSKFNISYIHLPSGLEVTLKTEDGEYVGLYGNSKMQGLFITSEYSNADKIVYIPIPQNLLDEKLAHLYNNVGMHYYDQKDYQEAINYFDNALGIDSEYSQAWFNKAGTHVLLGEAESGLSALEKAIQINPEVFKGKAKKDKDFDAIRGLSELQSMLD